MSREVEVAIIGAGSAGLYALSQVRRHTGSYLLFDGGTLGTTCARVGCMPSKVLIQVADDFHRRHHHAAMGIAGGADLRVRGAEVLAHLRRLRDGFVEGVLGSGRFYQGEHFVPANVRFVDTHTLETADGERVQARRIIIATGSRPVVPAPWRDLGERLLTTDTLFELEDLPASVAVIGLGAVGLEVGQALARLGVRVTGVDQLTRIGGLDDEAVNATALEVIGEEFPLWLGTGADVRRTTDGRLAVSAGHHDTTVDAVVASLGRRPNLGALDLPAAGVALDERGRPAYDPHTLRIENSDIYIAGDCNAERPLLHEAAFEGRVAGYNAVRDEPMAFRRQVPIAITFCSPNIAKVGTCLPSLAPEAIVIGESPLDGSGRARIIGEPRGLIRVYAEKATGRVLGATLFAPQAEHLAHLLAWSIDAEQTVADLLARPFYHPTLEETLQDALAHAAKQLHTPAQDWPTGLRPLD
jgi:dihydrolipoamide dehydrogenase